MSGSTALHHKNNRLGVGGIPTLERVENESVTPHSAVRPAFPDVAATRGVGAYDGELKHEKSSLEKDFVKSAPVSKAPPAPKPKAPPPSVPDLLRGDGDAANVGVDNTGDAHSKKSAEQNFDDPKPPPKAKVPPLPNRDGPVFESLRDQHRQSNGGGNGGNAGAYHAKWSQEQNAQNPEKEPEPWMPPEPTDMPTPAHTTDINIMRVNPAPENEGEGRSDDCRAVDGVYFGKGQGGSRNGGVVLRYRYELHEDGAAREGTRANNGWYENNIDNLVDGGGGKPINAHDGEEPVGYHLTRDILPKLEGGITDALIPVFFEGCPDVGEGDGRRLSEGSDMGRRRNNRLRHRRLTAVVGIDSRPGDIPLGQQVCESKFIASVPDQIVECHVMEGALTLYFPPNSSVHTSVLSAATLTTLRAIDQGMTDGSLALSHPAIRKLHFSADKYGLQPGLDIPRDKGGGAGAGAGAAMAGTPGAEQGNGIGNWGLILGITLPLIVLCCCCCYCVGVWKIRRRGGDDDDDHGIEDSMPSEPMRNLPMLEAKRMFCLEDGYTDSGTEYDEEDMDLDTDHGHYRAAAFGEFRDETSTDDESAKGLFQDQGYGLDAVYFVDDQGTALSESEISGDDSSASLGQDTISSDCKVGERDEEDYSEPEKGDEKFEEEDSEAEDEEVDEQGYSEPVKEEDEENYSKPEEEEGESVAAPATSNPLNPIFKEAERERAKKRKQRRQEKHTRRRMERLNREKKAAVVEGERDNA